LVTTALPRATAADLARVGECLDMLAPRWNAWLLMSLERGPLRYFEIKSQLPWLRSGQLAPRLHQLTDDGLLKRGQLNWRHVTYGLTDRGAAAIPVLEELAAWGSAHLEKELVLNPGTGLREPERIPKAQDAEDTLGLISPRYAAPALWTLRIRGVSTARELAATVMPNASPSGIYPPLHQLTDDGLIERTAPDAPRFQLTEAGASLAPVFTAMSAWAAGRDVTTTRKHPVWGQKHARTLEQRNAWATHQPRSTGLAGNTVPIRSQPQREAGVPAWKPNDLFSHRPPAQPAALATPGGRRR
jgi:DNA-binding HxlR family transcriptional regulator